MNEVQKTQAIRLYGDVLFIGPFLVYLAVKGQTPTPYERWVMGGIGVATIGYNLRNYLKQRAS